MMNLRKKPIYKILSLLLTVAALFTVLPGGLLNALPVKAATITHNVETQGRLVIEAGDTNDYIITGTFIDPLTNGMSKPTGIIDIASGYQGTITLKNLSLRTNDDRAAIILRGNEDNNNPSTRVNMVLEGTNYVHSGSNHKRVGDGSRFYSDYAGITVCSGAQITIDGPGSLDARATHLGANDGNGGAAGIGGGGSNLYYRGPLQGGNIHIKGGTVKAYGSYHAAAIGGGISLYNGNVVVSGGNVTCKGGSHGAGIGGGCENTGAGSKPPSESMGTGVVAVLPPGNVTATGGDPTKYVYTVGMIGTKVYIGDPNSPMVQVKTEEITKNADIFMDIRSITIITNILTKLQIPISQVNPAELPFGNTGTTGIAKLNMESGAANAVSFFTKESTSDGLKFVAVSKAITAAQTIVLPKPVFKVTVASTPATVPALTFNYGTVPTGNRVTATIKNEGNTPVSDLTAVLPAGSTAKYEIVSGLTPVSLTVGQTATVVLQPKLGLQVGTHMPQVTVGGNGISGTGTSTPTTKHPITPQTVNLTGQVVNKAAVLPGKGGSVAAIPAPNADYQKYTSLNLKTSTSTDSAIVSWQYAFSNSATTPGAGWVSKAATDTNITANFPSTPIDGDYYVHWKMVNSNYADTSGVISVYKLDRTPPVVSSITTTAPGAGDGQFDVTVKFNENVTMMQASGLQVTNADIQSIVRKGVAQDEFVVTLKRATGLAAGSKIKVQVRAGAVNDKAVNPNTASSAAQDLEIIYNTAVPAATYSYANNKLFPAVPAVDSITVTLKSNGIGNKTLYQAGASPTTEITAAYAASFITVNGAPLAAPVTATMTKSGDDYVFKINRAGGFIEGTYTIATVPNIVQNKEGNKLAASSSAFIVSFPNLTGMTDGLTVTPKLLSNTGGQVALTIKGTNLKNNTDAGNLELIVKGTGPNGYTYSKSVTSGLTTTAGVDSYTITGVSIPANTTIAVQEYTYTLHYKISGGAEQNATHNPCKVQVEPDSSHIMTVINGTATVTNLEFTYPEDASVTGSKHAGRTQTVTVTNKGAQTLTITGVSLIGTNGTSFAHSTASITTLAPNATATITVWLKAGQNAGSYGGGAVGSETKLLVNASRTSGPVSNSAALVKQVVTPKNGGGTGTTHGEVKASVLPSNDWKNHPSVTLTAHAYGVGDTVKSWKYAVSESTTVPVAGSPEWKTVGGGVATATHTFLKTTDKTYYIYWVLDTNNYVGIDGEIVAGAIKTYKIDVTEPKVTSITANNTVIGNGPLVVTIVFDEANVTGALTSTGLALTNCAFVSATGPTVVGNTTEYVATIKANTGLVAGAKINVGVSAGAVKDKATNPNQVSSAGTNLVINYSVNSPEVTQYSFAEGQEYPGQQTSATLTIKPNGTLNNTLLDGAGIPLTVGSPAPFVTVDDHGIAGAYTANVSAIDGSGNVTITVTGTFGTGDYTVKIASGGIVNAEGNALIPNQRTFKVRIPVIVPPTVPGEINGKSFNMTPPVLSSAGGTSVATIYGVNLQFAGTLEIEDPQATPTRQRFTVAPDGKSATYKATLPANYTPLDAIYLYDAYLNGALHNAQAQVTVEASVPKVNAITATVTAGNIAISPLTFDNKGGTVDLTVDGNSLQAFGTLEIKEGANTYNVASAAFTQITNVFKKGVTLPANIGLTDILYTFEVFADGAATGKTVTITVQGSYPTVHSLTFDTGKFTSAGGSSASTISGIYLDNFLSLTIRDLTTGQDLPVAISADPDRTKATSAVVNFPKWTGGLRNDIYDFEVYADGNPTGVVAQVEVGDSIPNHQSVDANPNYFPDVKATLYGKGRSEITLHGNYLFNYKTLQLWDDIYQRFYTFSKVEDMTAKQTVAIPSAEGIYYYNVWIDGIDTGLRAEIGVGVTLGTSGPKDLEPDLPIEHLDYNNDKHWVSRGGGSKGRGFTGRLFVGFDLLEYQCEQEAKKNPKDPIVIVPDVDFITQDQLDLAATGSTRGARASEKAGKGILTLWFDTTWMERPDELEGRLHLSLAKPIPDLHPGVFVEEDEIKEIISLFRSRFDNTNMTAVSLGQHGKYGDRVEIVADADLTAFNTKALCFYRFDRVTGEYTRMTNTEHYIDTSGYLHFFTDKGDEIIITDTPLSTEFGSFPVVVEK